MWQIRVHGTPAPKGSYRAITGKDGKARLIPMSKREKPWRDAVRKAADYLQVFLAPCPLKCRITFYILRPKTVKREHPTVPPDLDKLCRSTLDGLQDSQMLQNDSLIVELEASKQYVEEDPGCLIEIERI